MNEILKKFVKIDKSKSFLEYYGGEIRGSKYKVISCDCLHKFKKLEHKQEMVARMLFSLTFRGRGYIISPNIREDLELNAEILEENEDYVIKVLDPRKNDFYFS